MQHTRLIPFWILPGSWGLNGKAYAEAEACYLYSGYELEHRLLSITCATAQGLAEAVLDLDVKYAKITPYERDCALLRLRGLAEDERAKAEVDLRHNRISAYDFDLLVAQLAAQTDMEWEHAGLEVKLRHGRLTKLAYDKAKADLNEKPWIGIVDQGFDMEKGVNGVYFEFDWNTYWVEYLRLNGYVGHSEEAIVERWFEDVCRATAEANPAHGEPGLFAVATPFSAPSRTTTRVRGDDGTFYS